MVLRADATHYQPISWDDTFSLIAHEVESWPRRTRRSFTHLENTERKSRLPTSSLCGIRHNNLPDCSNMCHEASAPPGLTNVLGFGKGHGQAEVLPRRSSFCRGHNPGTNHRGC